MDHLPPLDPDEVNLDEYADCTPVEAYLKGLAEDGAESLHAEIHQLDLNELRKDPEFRKAEKLAKARFGKKLLDRLMEYAMDGIPEELTFKGKLTGDVRRKHDAALLMRVIEQYLPEFQKNVNVTHHKEIDLSGVDVEAISAEKRDHILALIEGRVPMGAIEDAEFEEVEKDGPDS